MWLVIPTKKKKADLKWVNFLETSRICSVLVESSSLEKKITNSNVLKTRNILPIAEKKRRLTRNFLFSFIRVLVKENEIKLTIAVTFNLTTNLLFYWFQHLILYIVRWRQSKKMVLYLPTLTTPLNIYLLINK